MNSHRKKLQVKISKRQYRHYHDIIENTSAVLKLTGQYPKKIYKKRSTQLRIEVAGRPGICQHRGLKMYVKPLQEQLKGAMLRNRHNS